MVSVFHAAKTIHYFFHRFRVMTLKTNYGIIVAWPRSCTRPFIALMHSTPFVMGVVKLKETGDRKYILLSTLHVRIILKKLGEKHLKNNIMAYKKLYFYLY